MSEGARDPPHQRQTKVLCSVALLLYCIPAASCDDPKLLRSFSTCNLSSDGEYWKQFSLIKVIIKTALKSDF